MGSAPAHLLGTIIIMKFLLVVAVVVVAAVDAFVLPPSSYLVDQPVPDHSVLVHDGLHLLPVQVPGVPAVYASPPLKRERREDEDEDGVDPAYLGVPFGALSLNIGSAYGALALYRPGTPYGALGNVVLPYAALQPPYTPPTGCLNPYGWNIPCTNLNAEQEGGAETEA